MLWHALLLSHQPHDNTYGLAATPDGRTFVDSATSSTARTMRAMSWQSVSPRDHALCGAAGGAGVVGVALARRAVHVARSIASSYGEGSA